MSCLRFTRLMRGFTLIELMIALTIIAISVSIVLPIGTSLVRENHLTTETNTLVRDLHFARTEAVKRGSRITICGSIDGTRCSHGGWTDGWVVFTDDTGQIGIADGTDVILLRRPKATRDISLDSGSSYVVFSGTGTTTYALEDTAPLAPAKLAQKLALFPVQVILNGLTSPAHAAATTTSCIASTGLRASSGAAANCNGASLSSFTQAAFLVCDAARTGEKGNLLSISHAGRISHSRVICD